MLSPMTTKAAVSLLLVLLPLPFFSGCAFYPNYPNYSNTPSPLKVVEARDWLGIAPAATFNLRYYAIKQDKRYVEKVIPYFHARGVKDRSTIDHLVALDLRAIDQALTLLFARPHSEVIKRLVQNDIPGMRLEAHRIDHVGRELFGPMDVYLQILSEQSAKLGLRHDKYPPGKGVTKEGNLIFPSVQVVEVFRKTDPQVVGVTIGRIFFTVNGDPATKAGLELFQASALNNQNPQSIEATLQRQASLFMTASEMALLQKKGEASVQRLPEPVAHLAIALPNSKQVYAIHNRLGKAQSKTMKLYGAQVAYNPGDNSTNTKFALRDNYPRAPFNRIIELISYK
ncbi:hypothetical protein [Candidatus Sororendozoicomonas aggregata]|uniref:hypothetical protein n=1 Tax=Candidatus Sororendozoicomonas aggregata TaxID=3073239 RepID=UPI002ED1ED80